MKKGFTLVELLAVIIVLAAILLIVIPSVNHIISSSKKSLSDAQIKNIEKAAEQYYLSEGMDENKSCVNINYLIENEYLNSDKIIDTNEEEMVGSVKIEYKNNKYNYTYIEERCAICDVIVGDGTSIGDKLVCEVKPGSKYTFYVLSKENDGTTNLIMDRNICDDGNPTDDGKTCVVAWSSSGLVTEGPVDAMNYLDTATKDWINVNEIKISSFERFSDNSEILEIIEHPTFTLRSRMPFRNEVSRPNGTNTYLYENMDWSSWYNDESSKPQNNISGVKGYWVGSIYVIIEEAWVITSYGRVDTSNISDSSFYGVRPVINISNTDIQVSNPPTYICRSVDEDTVTTGNIPEGYYEPGDEYICEVKPGVKYRFFVVSTEGNNVNLLMERNICRDGTVATEENKCTVAWNAGVWDNQNVPITAMNYLNEVTNSWTNIQNLNITYDDEGGHFTNFKITGKSRLPYKKEISKYDDINKTNSYLYDYLSRYGTIQENEISSISGYWTLSSSSNSDSAWIVEYSGNIYDDVVPRDDTYGVRPVISVSKNSIK